MKLKPNEDEDAVFEHPDDRDSVIIIDAMVVLEVVKKYKPMAKVSDLADYFMLELNKQANGYSEVRLIFQRFERSVLNESRHKTKNLKKVPIHYHVKLNTPIKNIDAFLAHIKTRRELTCFLGQKVVEYYKESEIKCLVAHDNKFFINESMNRFTNLSNEHSLSDLKQIILTNVVDIGNVNQNRLLTIHSTDVDLAILLVGIFHRIPPYTTMKVNRSCIKILDLYNRLDLTLSNAIIGWYAFYGKKILKIFVEKSLLESIKMMTC